MAKNSFALPYHAKTLIHGIKKMFTKRIKSNKFFIMAIVTKGMIG